MAAIQIGLSNPNFGLPLDHSSKVETVETYIVKPTLPETVITPPEIPHKPRTSVFSENTGYEVIGDSNEQCVIYAKRVTGITKSIGYAGKAKPEGYEPRVGSIALQRSIGHAVAVESITDSGIIVTEANYRAGKIDRRFIPFTDIRGYIY